MSGHISVAVVVGALEAATLFWPAAPLPRGPPDIVRIAGGVQDYWPSGEFRQGTMVVDAPLLRVEAEGLEIMKHHVSEAEYARCVIADACPSLPGANRQEYAQTGVNHDDATAYAAWLSAVTGEHWRLPTDAEWLRAAAERGADDGFAPDANGTDPSRPSRVTVPQAWQPSESGPVAGAAC